MGDAASAVGAWFGEAGPAFAGWWDSWFWTFAQSSGFGGVAAVVAAGIAYAAVRRQTVHARDAQRKEQWWKRAEWALNHTMSDDVDKRTVGYQVLTALAESEWANEHEGDVIAAATERGATAMLDDETDAGDPAAVGDETLTVSPHASTPAVSTQEPPATGGAPLPDIDPTSDNGADHR